MPWHCLWAKSNIRTRGQFECDVTLFWFCFDFIHSHAWCSCCSIACWRGFKIGRLRSRGRKNCGRSWVGGSWKLHNFHGRHMCIVLYFKRRNFQESQICLFLQKISITDSQKLFSENLNSKNFNSQSLIPMKKRDLYSLLTITLKKRR